MIPYTPKLDIGDTVWIMKLNKPVEAKIIEVCITYSSKSTCVEYTITGGLTLLECTDTMPGDFIYRTKQELIASL
jgi:hypothetical protein